MKLRLFRRPDPHSMDSANHALRRAEKGLEVTRQQSAKAHQVTSSLMKLHEQNHWSEQFKAAMSRRY